LKRYRLCPLHCRSYGCAVRTPKGILRDAFFFDEKALSGTGAARGKAHRTHAFFARISP
jgi:hypothetical protein